MAYVTAVTIGTSNKVSVDYQSQEVSVSVTFQLERSDEDLVSFVEARAADVERAHSTVWRRIRELRSEQKASEAEARQASIAAEEPQAERPPRRRRAVANGTKADANGHAATAVAEAPAEPEAAPNPQPELPSTTISPSEARSSVAQHRALLTLANRAGMTDAGLTELLEARCGKSRLDDLTKHEAAQLLMELQRGDRA